MPPPRFIRLQTLLVPLIFGCGAGLASAQLNDLTQTPNTAGAGIHKSYVEQIGAGRGDVFTPESSAYIIARDPFRAVRRGRQVFQRKFTHAQGLGPRTGDGVGDIEQDGSLGAGLVDSCAGCHGRPFGAAGFGGNVFTRPQSRDAPHLFGLGLQEMLADEITKELRAQREEALEEAFEDDRAVTVELEGKGIEFGELTAFPDGSVDTSDVYGVDADLRVRPFFAQGGTISIREFAVGAFNAEMGLEAADPDLLAASQGADVVTPAGMELTGSMDAIEPPPVIDEFHDGDGDGVVDELPTSIIDAMEFYLLNYFKPGAGPRDSAERNGQRLFDRIGCTECHVADLWVDRDRRVADVETVFDPLRSNGVFNDFFATAATSYDEIDDGSGYPTLKPPSHQPFLVESIYTDFRRHDLGPGFWEENFDGTIQKEFITEPLWGVGDTAPYGHDGRSGTLREVILRHGGAAQESVDEFLDLSDRKQGRVLAFLNSLRLFSPEDTASNLNPADRGHPNFPLDGHGSISLTPLFVDPTDIE